MCIGEMQMKGCLRCRWKKDGDGDTDLLFPVLRTSGEKGHRVRGASGRTEEENVPAGGVVVVRWSGRLCLQVEQWAKRMVERRACGARSQGLWFA